jgi:CelD/BcsL family acetyltransferase involved in cellulose biosynthesis
MYDAAMIDSDPAGLTLRRWSIGDWLASEAVWQELLSRSGADPLFLSWEWLTHWWSSFGNALAAVPDILAFYRGRELVGIAPLYRRRVLRRGVPTSSVQLVGVSWRDSGALISEYLDVIAAAGEADAVRHACARVLLEERTWQEWLIGFTAASPEWCEAFSRCADGRCYVRDLDSLNSYQANLSGGFAAYIGALGQSTRRSVSGLRHRLGAAGEVEFRLLGAEEIDSGLSDLNRLHQLRWHKPAFRGAALAFHRGLARRLARRGELALSRLRVRGEVVSVLYDIRKGTRQYNIHMGFNPSFSSRLSLGLIHLGYAMEAAAGENVRTYDLLAGTGQKSDYKRHLSQSHRRLSCVQVLRGRLLPALYRLHDRARQASVAGISLWAG